MIVHKLLKRGLNHPNFCEDFILDEKLNQEYSLFGVFDGCSSGVDSHLASTLIAKIIRAEANKINIEKLSFDEILEKITFKTLKSLKKISKKFFLSKNELLSTIILFLYNQNSDKGKIISIGDGFLSINKHEIEINQNNQPNYLAYNIDEIRNKKEFKIWYDENVGKYDVENLEDVTISTDGIFSFANDYNSENYNNKEINIIEYLTQDKNLFSNKAMLGRKYNILKKTHFLQNFDDLGIIRIIKQ
ncbi:MAG: protein phosphatase 2C domain-containing protein [Bacteroidales bacterium]|nr:protein phosphatase 2C domain-containing protein [Bacteroidales bacterium]MBN2756682.1 protein phosphatase 2C domain-containing protein [Bacteroidales bacterium]